MSTYKKMTRRRFLHTMACMSATALLGSGRFLAKLGTFNTHDSLTSRLIGVFIHRKSAKIVGLEYLRSVPNEADVNLLTDLICSSQAERRAELLNADTEKRREILLHQQQLDFEYGRIVNVNGWILSVTEARLCALVALV